jgi:hypothetical protein
MPKLDWINPPFSRFELGDKSLGFLQELGHVYLIQTGLKPCSLEFLQKPPVVLWIGRSHGFTVTIVESDIPKWDIMLRQIADIVCS